MNKYYIYIFIIFLSFESKSFADSIHVLKDNMSYSYGFGFYSDGVNDYISFADSHSVFNDIGDGAATIYLSKNDNLSIIYKEFFKDFNEINKNVQRLIERQIIDFENSSIIAVSNSHNAVISYGFDGTRKILTRNITGPINIITGCNPELRGSNYLIVNRRNVIKSINSELTPIGVYSIINENNIITTKLIEATRQSGGELRTLGCFNYNGNNYIYTVNTNTGILYTYKWQDNDYYINDFVNLSILGHFMTHIFINQEPYFIFSTKDGIFAHHLIDAGTPPIPIVLYDKDMQGIFVTEISALNQVIDDKSFQKFAISTREHGFFVVSSIDLLMQSIKHFPINERLVGVKVYIKKSKFRYILNSEYGSQRISILSQ